MDLNDSAHLMEEAVISAVTYSLKVPELKAVINQANKEGANMARSGNKGHLQDRLISYAKSCSTPRLISLKTIVDNVKRNGEKAYGSPAASVSSANSYLASIGGGSPVFNNGSTSTYGQAPSMGAQGSYGSHAASPLSPSFSSHAQTNSHAAAASAAAASWRAQNNAASPHLSNGGGTTPSTSGAASTSTAPPGSGGTNGLSSYGTAPGSSSYGAYGAASSSTLGGQPGSSGTSTPTATSQLPMRFHPSPFFRVERSLMVRPAETNIVDQNVRRSISAVIRLDSDTCSKLDAARASSENPQYQIRVYSCSQTHISGYRGNSVMQSSLAHNEYPAQCDFRLNDVPITANTKGVKKQPGSANPVNLTDAKGHHGQLLFDTSRPNATYRVEMLYCNPNVESMQRYYWAVYLVEYTPVSVLLERIKTGKLKTKETVIQEIIASNASDEDLEAGNYEMSLKCPLTYMRVSTPVRASTCAHTRCFDANSFLLMNDNLPTWKCPVCNRSIRYENLVLDGYFEDILKTCPDSVETVIVEPDGKWRSSDGKYGTAPPPDRAASNAIALGSDDEGDGPAGGNGDLRVKGESPANGWGGPAGNKRTASVTIDSDDDDIDDSYWANNAPAKRFRAYMPSDSATPGSSRAGSNVPGQRRQAQVIDLTLSDDDE